MNTREVIESGQIVLGVEFGSTRIKAVLIGEDHLPIAWGSYEWENRYENGIWTYHLEDVWAGLQESYRQLSTQVYEKYHTPLQMISAMGFSAMMHGYMAFDINGNLLVPFRHGGTQRPDGQQRNSHSYFNSTSLSVGVLPTFIRQS